MPSTGSKGSATPFKTMDIKSALLSSGSRKRKLSSQLCKSEVKKLSLDKDDENDVEILDEVCGTSVTLDQSALENKDGKENKDVNAKNNSLETPLSADCKENKNLNIAKDEPLPNVAKSPSKLDCPLSPKPAVNNSDEMEPSLSEKSKDSDVSSCDELDVSIINSSINVSLNTSGLSLTGDDAGEDEKEANASSKKTEESNTKGGEIPETNQVKEKVKKKKMTPAEAKQKAEEREQKQKERLQKKEELENKKKERQLEKEKRLKEKLLRKEREEIERKERERQKQEKKEQEEKEKQQKEKERLQKQKEKEEKNQQKLEEKKKKEEIKQKRDEELKKAEEEKLRLKLEKEQKEREKVERAKAAFAKFFVKGNTPTSAPAAQITEKEGAFLPFQVSDDMILAPVVPPAAQERFDKKQLDRYLECQDGKELYIQILNSGSYKDVRLRKKNRKIRGSEADVIVLNENAKAELGFFAKLLQFSENVRPPYWGTWRKKSKNIRPRNPFAQDEEIFDYSVDSDDEWDEGGPGESLSGTEHEDEDENEDDYEVDNEFFVPHGYLSDEEEKKEDDDEEVNDPEKQKALLKIKLQEFEMERKKKTTELKPIILGCYFANHPAFADSGIQTILLTYSAEILSETPIPTKFTIKQQPSKTTESPKSTNSSNAPKKKKLLVPEKALPELIRLVHGNIRNKKSMAEEFQKVFTEQFGDTLSIKPETIDEPSSMEVDAAKDTTSEPPTNSTQLSLRQVQRTIQIIATYGKPPDTTINKCCWWVHDNIRKKYGLMDAPLPCGKDYVMQKVEEKQLPAVKGTSIKEFLAQN